jgi:hypothetical protein
MSWLWVAALPVLADVRHSKPSTPKHALSTPTVAIERHHRLKEGNSRHCAAREPLHYSINSPTTGTLELYFFMAKILA